MENPSYAKPKEAPSGPFTPGSSLRAPPYPSTHMDMHTRHVLLLVLVQNGCIQPGELYLHSHGPFRNAHCNHLRCREAWWGECGV